MESEGNEDRPRVPSERVAGLGDALNRMRGVVMTCYAQIEFHLADLSLRCSYLECYSGMAIKHEWKLNDRIKTVLSIVAVEGPLSAYRQVLEDEVWGINEFTDLRHLMAHAMAHMDISPTNHVLHFEMYEVVKGGAIKLVVHRTTLDALSAVVERLVAYANMMVSLFLRIRNDLPTRVTAQGDPVPDP